MSEKFIDTREKYQKAVRWVQVYKERVKAGTATEKNRRRIIDLEEHILCYLWAEVGRKQQLRLKRVQEAANPAPAPVRSAVAVRFADWYERIHKRPGWRATDWMTAWLHFVAPQDVDETDTEDAERELTARALLAKEMPGMVVTSLEQTGEAA